MLNESQYKTLSALIDLYEEKKAPVRGEEIADRTSRTSGTIRNQMQILHALGYVEGTPGPKGGYIPSIKAYESMGIEAIESPVNVPIYQDGEEIEGLYVEGIALIKVPHPSECAAIVSVIGDTKKIRDRGYVKIGPTPLNHIILKGAVIGRDDTRREILIETESITSIPKETAESFIKKKLITFDRDMGIKECASVLAECNIEGAPVIERGKTVGIITMADIVNAFVEGKTEGTVKDICIGDILTVDKDTQLIDCIKIMDKYSIGRLIITDEGKAVGILTRTDIVNRMME